MSEHEAPAAAASSAAPTPAPSRLRGRLYAIAAVLAVLLALGCWLLRIDSPQAVLAYGSMAIGRGHPIRQQLALRRISQGDDLAAVEARFAPDWRNQRGDVTEVVYYSGDPAPDAIQDNVTLVARNGRLEAAYASGASWSVTFFESADARALQKPTGGFGGGMSPGGHDHAEPARGPGGTLPGSP